MKDIISSYLKIGNTFYGIEYFLRDGKDVFMVFGLKKSKKKLKIIASEQLDTIKSVSKRIGKAVPVYLVVNTSDVLTKSIDINSATDNQILNTAFPNLNQDEFYYEILKQNEKAFISICRKGIIDNLIRKYDNAGITVIDFSIGVLAVSNIMGFIKTEEALSVSNVSISHSEKEIKIIEKQSIERNIEYDINGLKVESQYILSSSGAISAALNVTNLSHSYDDLKTVYRNKFKQARIFKIGLRLSLIMLLTISSINYLTFNHYYKEVNILKETSQITSSSKDKVLSLTSKILKSQKMVDDVQRSSGSKTTYFVNDIISELPNSIVLNKLNYQPLSRKIRQNKPIQNALNEIVINGNSINDNDFSIWLGLLEKLSWVKAVDIIEYKNISDINADFIVNIKINETTKA